jgi:hypothetical protein
MTSSIYDISDKMAYEKAGPYDLIKMLPPPGDRTHPLIIPKYIPEVLVYSFVNHEKVHLSGKIGCGKTMPINSLEREPENFKIICEAMGFDFLPLKIYSSPMAIFECPSELYFRRALEDGNTFDEPSILLKSLQEAASLKEEAYTVIHIREFGRVQSSTCQTALPDIMVEGDILLPDGNRIDVSTVGWICDSNYADQHDNNYTLVSLDDALKRRFSINLRMDSLTPDQELTVLEHISEYH